VFQGDWSDLRRLVLEKAPAALRELAAGLSEIGLKESVDRYLRGEDRASPASFFARVMLRRDPPRPGPAHANRCPQCGEPPQCGCLYPEGHGSAFFLVCSLCAAEWPFPRAQCPGCGEQAVFYSAERLPHIQTQVCEHCRLYLHVIDLGTDPKAVPLVDEVAALAMDVWAIEGGFRKIHPNLVGI
jgi:FdhE protein